MTSLSAALASGDLYTYADCPPALSFLPAPAGVSPAADLQRRVEDAALRSLFALSADVEVPSVSARRICAMFGSAITGWGIVFATAWTLFG